MSDKDNKLQNIKKPQFLDTKDLKLSKPLHYYKSLYSGVVNKFTSKLLNRNNIGVATDYLKVERNHLRNEIARITSKGTSTVSSGGTFNHALAKGYLDACNGYFMQRSERNNININLAREFSRKETEWLMRKSFAHRR